MTPARAPGQQAVLAHGVGEVLGHAVAEHPRRLVPVEPRGHAEAAWARRPPAVRASARTCSARPAQAVTSGGERRHRGEAAQRLVEGASGPGRRRRGWPPPSRPGRLRWPPGARRGPAPAPGRRRGVRRRAARGGVAAHDPDHGPAGDQLVQGVATSSRRGSPAAGSRTRRCGRRRRATSGTRGRPAWRRSRLGPARRTAPRAGRGSPGRGRPGRAGRWERSARDSGAGGARAQASAARRARPAPRGRCGPAGPPPGRAGPGPGAADRRAGRTRPAPGRARPGSRSPWGHPRRSGRREGARTGARARGGAGSAAQAGLVHLAVEAHAREPAEDGADEAGHRDDQQGDDAAGAERALVDRDAGEAVELGQDVELGAGDQRRARPRRRR